MKQEFIAFLIGFLIAQFFSNIRENYSFLDDLFLQFSMIVIDKSLDVSEDSENDYKDNINYFCIELSSWWDFSI